MSARDLIDGEADLDQDDEENESYDEETGEVRRKRNGSLGSNEANGNMEDSSEEEDEDDDEEAARQVREGFIVEDEEEPEERERRKQERRKRRREEREEEEQGLDEEDLDLIGEAHPELERRSPAETKFKRLKRGHKGDREDQPRGLQDIFDDEEEEELRRPGRRNAEDEFADFIEEDFEDERPDQDEDDDDNEIRRKPVRSILDAKATTDLDEAALEDMNEAFGTGNEYDWALELQDRDEAGDEADADPESALSKGIELKDVFEPSQLQDKMLTDEDNFIRMTDQPERFQIARKPYSNLELTDRELEEESYWIARLMLPNKRFEGELQAAFLKAICI